MMWDGLRWLVNNFYYIRLCDLRWYDVIRMRSDEHKHLYDQMRSDTMLSDATEMYVTLLNQK